MVDNEWLYFNQIHILQSKKTGLLVLVLCNQHELSTIDLSYLLLLLSTI